MTALRLIKGGRAPRPTATVLVSDLENLHLELTVSRKERVAFTAQALQMSRAIQRAVAAGNASLAGVWADQLEKAAIRERDRAFAMDASSCPCGCDGSGHGPASSDALALPARKAS